MKKSPKPDIPTLPLPPLQDFWEHRRFLDGVRRNFRRRVASYDRHANVQRFMAWALLAQTAPFLPQAQRILEVGCGTGYLTAALRALQPQAHLIALDLDPTLLCWTRRRLGPQKSLSWLVADGEATPLKNLDLIISNSTFQWFRRPQDTLHLYSNCLTSGGCLAFSTLGPGTFTELAESLRRAGHLLNMPHIPAIPAASFLTAHDWRHLLTQTGFHIRLLDYYPVTIHFPDVMSFLKAVQATGATNPQPRPFSPRLLRALTSAYLELYGQPSHIPVTYEIILAVAVK